MRQYSAIDHTMGPDAVVYSLGRLFSVGPDFPDKDILAIVKLEIGQSYKSYEKRILLWTITRIADGDIIDSRK